MKDRENEWTIVKSRRLKVGGFGVYTTDNVQLIKAWGLDETVSTISRIFLIIMGRKHSGKCLKSGTKLPVFIY